MPIFHKRAGHCAALAAALMLPCSAWAADTDLRSQVEDLQKQLNDVQAQLAAQNGGSADGGLPANWLSQKSLVHLAGYASVGYTDRKTQNGSFSVGSFSPIFHYLYDDLLMMEAEMELGYSEDGTTETNLEYAALDLFLNDYVTLVGGQFLSPIGQFRQNFHPAWINKMPSKPLGFDEDEAAPLTETGVQLRGGFPLGSRYGNYAVYVGNGPRLEDNAGELEVGTENNSFDANQNKTVGGRLGFLPLPHFEVGVSGAFGKAGLEGEADRDYRVYDVDFAYQPATVELRGEYVRTEVGSLASSAIPDKHVWKAWYVQASHKFAPTGWEGVLRYGRYEPPEAIEPQKQWAVGVNYLWAPNVIGKLAYEFNSGATGTPADQNRVLVQLAYGF